MTDLKNLTDYPKDITDETELVPIRKAVAGPAFEYNTEFYTGILEDQHGLSYEQAEAAIEYARELFGAYKLEFEWGTPGWNDIGGGPMTSFGYSAFKDYTDKEYDLRVFDDDQPPVIIRFDIPDMCRAVRYYAYANDDPIWEADAEEKIEHRQQMIDKLMAWQTAIVMLRSELEMQIEQLRGKESVCDC